MTLGFVIGESKPTIVTGQTSRSLPIGEYVIVNSKEGKIVGLVEKSVVSSAALGDVKNYDETLESIEVAALNKRDKSYTAMIRILGFLESLQKAKQYFPLYHQHLELKLSRQRRMILGKYLDQKIVNG